MGSRKSYNYIIVKLTKKQNSIILGTLLGDGFLQKTGKVNARMRLEHGGKQKDYLLWKGRQFPRLFQGAPSFLERIHPLSKGKYQYWRWQSTTSPVLGEWREYFYKDGKKKIPKDLSQKLDKLALAIWYMDDGYYCERDKSSYIYLGRVSKEEAETAERAIAENFGINPKIYDKKQKGFALFFSVSETVKLHNEIRSQMLVPLFNYKLKSS